MAGCVGVCVLVCKTWKGKTGANNGRVEDMQLHHALPGTATIHGKVNCRRQGFGDGQGRAGPSLEVKHDTRPLG
ncbi:hypothetical protein E2C01_092206 [Portunus trituberculatus]|uniref:Uncharacterized protein n=1 Tax=Portunus trituberculatus TaxID=210409 RepID=A0A5B7JX54_PORTR|nr:hypothetical protein [Portunus trituberculatus]